MRQQTRDWQRNRDMWIRVLERQTGSGVDHWNGRIAGERLRDENELRRWLTAQGVTGYARTLLVMERFGYPDFLHVSLVSPVRTFARIVPATSSASTLACASTGTNPRGGFSRRRFTRR